MFMRSNDDNIEDISTAVKKKKKKVKEEKKLLPFCRNRICLSIFGTIWM
jgi:hypothetical protein